MPQFLAELNNKNYLKAMEYEDAAMQHWNETKNKDLTLKLADYFEFLGNAKNNQQEGFSDLSYTNTYGMAIEMLQHLVATTKDVPTQKVYLSRINQIQTKWYTINSLINFNFATNATN